MQEYHAHLVHVEEMFEETKVDIKRFQAKAEQQCKMVHGTRRR